MSSVTDNTKEGCLYEGVETDSTELNKVVFRS